MNWIVENIFYFPIHSEMQMKEGKKYTDLSG